MEGKSPHKQLKRDIWWILRALTYDGYLAHAEEENPITLENKVLLPAMGGEGKLDVERQRRILHKLEEWGAISIAYRGTKTDILLNVGSFDEIYLEFQKIFSDSLTGQTLTFDPKTGTISLGKKDCKIPYKKMEYYLVERLFKEPIGNRVSETTLQESIDFLGESNDKKDRRIYDAHSRLNKKIRSRLGIERLVRFEGTHYWIDPSLPTHTPD